MMFKQNSEISETFLAFGNLAIVSDIFAAIWFPNDSQAETRFLILHK